MGLSLTNHKCWQQEILPLSSQCSYVINSQSGLKKDWSIKLFNKLYFVLFSWVLFNMILKELQNKKNLELN